MRKRFLLAKVICAAALIGLPTFVSAQDGVFDSGSTGADGAYSPTVSEVFMVTKAEYNFTSVNIPSDVTVTFDSALDVNHPVVWLSQGDITIEGTVDLSGAQGHSSRAGMRPAAEGGPGGWNGGPGATALIGDPDTTLQAIAGQGPGGAIPGDSSQRSGSGGGHRTDGAVGSSSNALTVGRAYGNAFGQPLLGGSGVRVPRTGR